MQSVWQVVCKHATRCTRLLLGPQKSDRLHEEEVGSSTKKMQTVTSPKCSQRQRAETRSVQGLLEKVVGIAPFTIFKTGTDIHGRVPTRRSHWHSARVPANDVPRTARSIFQNDGWLEKSSDAQIQV